MSSRCRTVSPGLVPSTTTPRPQAQRLPWGSAPACSYPEEVTEDTGTIRRRILCFATTARAGTSAEARRGRHSGLGRGTGGRAGGRWSGCRSRASGDRDWAEDLEAGSGGGGRPAGQREAGERRPGRRRRARGRGGRAENGRWGEGRETRSGRWSLVAGGLTRVSELGEERRGEARRDRRGRVVGRGTREREAEEIAGWNLNRKGGEEDESGDEMTWGQEPGWRCFRGFGPRDLPSG